MVQYSNAFLRLHAAQSDRISYFCLTLYTPMMTVSRSFFFLFVASFLLMHTAAAQQTKTVTLGVSSKSNSTNGLLINQSIINTLSTGQSKAVQDMEISYNITYSSYAGNNDNSLWIRLHRIEIFGDQIYRQFTLGPALTPDIFLGQINAVNKGSETFKLTFQTGTNDQRISYVAGNESIASANISFTAVSFTEEARDRINQKVSLINEYWALSNLADSLLKQSETREAQITASIIPVFIFRDYLRKTILLFDALIAKESLNIHNVDPANLIAKREKLQRLYTRYNTIAASLMNGFMADETFAETFTNSFTGFQLQTIRRSLRADYRDSDLLVKSARFYPDLELKRHIDQFGSNTEMIAGQLFVTMIKKADSLIEQADYSNAISFYEDALAFVAMFNFSYDIPSVQERLDAARIGMLQSHLRIAARAVESGNEQLATIYKAKSSTFANSQFNEDHISMISEQPTELIKTYLRKGNLMLDQRRYAEAIQFFESAHTAAQNYYNTGFNETIIQGLFAAHRFVYLDLVQQAEQHYVAGKRQDADRRLQQALDYRADHAAYLRTSMEAVYLQNRVNASNQNLTAASTSFYDNRLIEQLTAAGMGGYPLQPRLSREDAKKQILSELPVVQLKAWANNLDEAWSLYGQLAEMRDSFNLQQDADIVSTFNELDKRMIERICLNHKFRHDDLIEQAKRMIQLMDVSKLEATLREALSIAVNNQGCLLTDEEARLMIARYEPLFLYQKAYSEVLNVLFNRGVYFAIPAYESLDKTIEMYQLQNFGVKHLSFSEFIRKQNNSSLTLQTMRYFIDEMNADRLAFYIDILANQQFNIDQAREIIEKAATLLAVADHAAEQKPYGLFVRSLASSDRRFVILQRQFERSSKQLSRSR